jgi:hypothetical protein
MAKSDGNRFDGAGIAPGMGLSHFGIAKVEQVGRVSVQAPSAPARTSGEPSGTKVMSVANLNRVDAFLFRRLAFSATL